MKSKITKNSHFLMLKNIPILAFDLDQGALVKVEGAVDKLPLPLRGRELKIEDIKKWLTQRALPIDRANAKALRTAIGVIPVEQLKVILRTKGLSLIDGYWIKQVKDNHLTWEQVNLFDNPFSSALEQTAFTGIVSQITIQGDLVTPEFSGQGSYVKSWKRENGITYLYKGNHSGKESESEVMVSKVLDVLGFEHVPYTLETHHGKTACKCPNMVTESKFTAPAFEVEAYTKEKYGLTVKDYTLKHYPQRWWEMMFTDGLVNNIDRHMLNWGYYTDSETGELLEPHPLFDHNCSFTEEKRENQYYVGKSLIEVAIFAKNRINNIEHKLNQLENWLNKTTTKKEFQNMFESENQYKLIQNNLNILRENK